MQILHFDTNITLALDIMVWLFFHLRIGHVVAKMPLSHFNPEARFYQSAPFEQDGLIYQKLFRVRSWKRLVPSLGSMVEDAYDLKRLSDLSVENLRTWIAESCRSEFCHWMLILPGFLFFLWNTPEVGWLMVLYAVLNNSIPIILQRYNRPRVRKLLKAVERQKSRERKADLAYEGQTALSNSDQ